MMFIKMFCIFSLQFVNANVMDEFVEIAEKKVEGKETRYMKAEISLEEDIYVGISKGENVLFNAKEVLYKSRDSEVLHIEKGVIQKVQKLEKKKGIYVIFTDEFLYTIDFKQNIYKKYRRKIRNTKPSECSFMPDI